MKLFNKKKREDDLAFSIGAPVKGKVMILKKQMMKCLKSKL